MSFGGLAGLVLSIAAAQAGPSSGAIVPVMLCDDTGPPARAWESIATNLRQIGWKVDQQPAAFSQPPRPCLRDLEPELRQIEGKALARYRVLDLDTASTLFSSVVDNLNAEKSLSSCVDLFIEANFYLGWIAYESGETDRGEQYFLRLLAVAPTWRPLPQRFPPTVRASFDKAVARLAESPPVRVDVNVLPAGAAVVLDAKRICRSPCAPTSVVPGRHFLEINAPGYEIYREVLRIRPGAAVRLDVNLNADPRGRLEAALRRGDDSGVVAELSALRAPFVLVLDPNAEKKTIRAQVVNMQSRRVGAPLQLDLAQLVLAATQITSALGAPGATSPTAAPTGLSPVLAAPAITPPALARPLARPPEASVAPESEWPAWIWPTLAIGLSVAAAGTIVYLNPDIQVQIRR